MSWGTNYTTTIYFNRSTYEHLYQVKDDIGKCKKAMSQVRERLVALAFMTEPKKFYPDSEEDLTTTITEEIKSLLEDYQTFSVDLSNLTSLESEWDDCHKVINGVEYGITAPKNVIGQYGCNRPFIDGDFIKAVDIDGNITEETKEAFHINDKGEEVE